MTFEDAAPRRRADFLAAAGIVGLALLLRAAWVGRLGLQGDEDISTLAFRGILSAGIPELPSGAQYWRAPLYSYLAAPLAASGIDWLPRVLSVLLSCLTTLLLIMLGARWVGRIPAMVGALLFALSLPEIHTGRMARFYVLYQVFALFFFYVLDRFCERPTGRWGLAALAAAGGAMVSHELGATLAVLFVLLAARPAPLFVRAAGMALVGVFLLLSIEQRSFVGHAMTRGTAVVGAHAGEGASSALPSPTALAMAVAAALLGASLAWWASRGKEILDRAAVCAGCAVVLAALGLGQVGLSVGLLLCVVLLAPDLFPEGTRRGALLALSAVVLAGGAAWLVISRLDGGSLWHSLRALGGGPLVMGRALLYPPAVAIPAALGLAWVLWSAFQGRMQRGLQFLALCVLLLTLTRGLLAQKVVDRYLADVWLLWELMAGWALVTAIRAPAWGPRLRWAVAAGVAVAVILLPGTSIAEDLRFVRRSPGERAPGRIYPPIVPDLRGAAAYLQSHALAGERIAATDWLTTYCYTRRVDLWLRSGDWERQSVLVDGAAHDVYLGARVVPTKEALLASAREGPVWVVAGGMELFDPDEKLDGPLRDFLRTQPAAWESSDGWTRILRLGRSRQEAAR